jgi:uncharacterized tellurite resistance protein B-like protein
MGWFTKENKENNEMILPSDMSPIESVTYLCTGIQLSDGQIDYEEKNIWIELISLLFPEHSEERANKFFSNAQLVLNSKSADEKQVFMIQVIERIKTFLDKNQQKILGEKISELVEADGMIMSGEINMVKLVESGLDIKIRYDSQL